jgi:glycosyltransferase involved in cell wall biosynthesis
LPTVLWWGRFDPDYSRNRILRKLLAELGWQVRDFRPRLSGLGDWEARLRAVPRPDLVWVPCFRQRDLAAASRWARSHGIPLLFDPLISAYDKQVDERGKLDADSPRARRLLAWERKLFRRADRIIADTPAHADYFAERLGADGAKCAVVYVGAEEAIFSPRPMHAKQPEEALEVLFYGSFIPLQGPGIVIEAARRYRGEPAKWTLLGNGPLRKACEEQAAGLRNVAFEDWMPYDQLPARIQQADILLGVFGTTAKASRVIPNKVFQSLASGRPVVTRSAGAYPDDLAAEAHSGLVWVPAGDAQGLAERVADLASDRDALHQLGLAAGETSRKHFSESVVRRQLSEALDGVRALIHQSHP